MFKSSLQKVIFSFVSLLLAGTFYQDALAAVSIPSIGSQGTNVIALQKFLIGNGFQIQDGPTGYFGKQTKIALDNYKASSTPLVSLDSNTPDYQNLVEEDGKANSVSLITFDIKTGNQSFELDQIPVTLSVGGNGSATISSFSLYDEKADVLASSTLSDVTLNLKNNKYVIPPNTTAAFNITASYANASNSSSDMSATVGPILGVDSNRIPLTSSSTLSGNTQYVYSAAPLFSLGATSTLSESQSSLLPIKTYAAGTFTFDVTAKGSDISIASTSAFTVGIYQDGSTSTVPDSIKYSQPAGTTLVNGQYVIPQNTTVRFKVTASADVTNYENGNYDMRLEKVRWSEATSTSVSSQSTSFLPSINGGKSFITNSISVSH